jgi:hypothetical protein
MTRGVRSGIKGAALAASRLGDVAATGADMAAKYLKKKEPPKRTLEDLLGESPKKAREREQEIRRETRGVKKPLFEKFKSGGTVKSSASKRADGCATKGKTRGRMV